MGRIPAHDLKSLGKKSKKTLHWWKNKYKKRLVCILLLIELTMDI